MNPNGPEPSKPYRVEGGWAVAEEEAEFLRGLAIALRPRCIAEVGTGTARSLRAFSEAAAYLAAYLDWPCAVWSCDVNSQACAIGRILCPSARVIHGDSPALARAISPAPDLVFIDGEHTEAMVRADFAAMKAVASEHAVYLFHDTRPGFRRMREVAAGLGAIALPTAHGISILA